jgi:limonene-1,2-epoxide hydrolase
MSVSPESVARNFMASWENGSKRLDDFLSEDAVYADPRGVQIGLPAIKKLLEREIQAGTTVEIKSIASNGGTVMVERVDTFPVAGKPFSLECVGVFEVGDDGRINRWREYFDWKSVTDRLKAAGIALPS